MPGDATRLLERLLTDPAFRRRFHDDPVSVTREAGFPDLAHELSLADDHDGRRLDVRESRSSAAGVFMAAALEGLGFLDGADFGGSPSRDPVAASDSASPSATEPAGAPDPATVPSASGLPHRPGPVAAPGTEEHAGGGSEVRVDAPVASTAPAVTPAQAEADQAARLVVQAQADADDQVARAEHAALAANPDEPEGSVDDGAGGSDGDQGSEDEAHDEDSGDGEEEDENENENEGQDEIGEGSRGEDANDERTDEPDGDSVSGGGPDGSDDDSTAAGTAPPAEDKEHDTSGGDGTPPDVSDGADGVDAGPQALAAVAEARKYLGTPYLWGGSSPRTGFDCSGLVQWAYAQAGIRIPRVTYDQIDVGQHVSRSDLLPGDLVFFRNSAGDVHHVGMSLGGDKFIQSPHTGDVVKISSLNEPYYAREFTGGRRYEPAVEHDERPEASRAQEGRAAATPDDAKPKRAAIDVRAVRRAHEARARDEAEAHQPGTRLFRALERQERGKNLPAGQGRRAVPLPVDDDSAAPSPAAPPELPADPAAEAAAKHLAEIHYGFVRDSANTPNYELLKHAGYNGVLFHANDPNLGQAIASARAAGIQSVGIWAPANMEDPATFAHRLAGLEQYKPDIVVPDVEAEGKGTPGTPEWDYSEEFARLYRQLVPNQTWAVTVIPNQDDFNYGAYTSRGAGVWPQTYGATYDTTFDPEAVVRRVEANGVDPRLINPVLAPNQSGDNLSHYASYALEDFRESFPKFAPRPAQSSP